MGALAWPTRRASSVVIPAFNEADAIARGRARALRPPAPGTRSSSSTTARRDDTAARAAAAGARRRAASLQQGQRRRGEDRHPPRDRRVRADHRRRRPAPARGRAAARRRGSASTTSSIGARVGDDAGDAARGASATRALNWLASYLTGRDIPDLTSGFRGARARVPARVPPPAAERLLDADDDDAGVHQGGLQRARSSRSRRAQRVGQSKIRLARDGAKFFMIILKIVTIFSPLRIFLPISVASFALGARLRLWTIATQRTSPNGVGAADPVRGDRLPRRPGLRTDLGAALRRPPVTRDGTRPQRATADRRGGARRASRCASRSRFSTGSTSR